MQLDCSVVYIIDGKHLSPFFLMFNSFPCITNHSLLDNSATTSYYKAVTDVITSDECLFVTAESSAGNRFLRN